MYKTSTNKRRAVSPIVAVLILIVVAVVGGGAVALLMGNLTSQTSNQASTQGNAQKASAVLNIGGSTTVFPLTEAVKGNFTAKTNIQINDAQGGSGAGMIGVDQGVLDIGAASSVKAYNDEVAKDPTANLQAFNIGGSGIVWIAKGSGANGGIAAGGNECTIITQQTLKQLYTSTSGSFFTPACTAAGLLQITGNATHATSAGAGDVQFYTRGDLPSGTAETAAGWVYQDPSKKDFSAGSAQPETGNPGVFAAVNAGSATLQTLGYVDVGFDKSGSNAVDKIMDTHTSNQFNIAAPTGGTGSVNAGSSVSSLEKNVILPALKGLASTPASPQFPPDNTNQDAQLVRTFYYVTKGAPSASEQSFLDFVRSTDPTVTDAFNILGYYPIYSFK